MSNFSVCRKIRNFYPIFSSNTTMFEANCQTWIWSGAKVWKSWKFRKHLMLNCNVGVTGSGGNATENGPSNLFLARADQVSKKRSTQAKKTENVTPENGWGWVEVWVTCLRPASTPPPLPVNSTSMRSLMKELLPAFAAPTTYASTRRRVIA